MNSGSGNYDGQSRASGIPAGGSQRMDSDEPQNRASGLMEESKEAVSGAMDRAEEVAPRARAAAYNAAESGREGAANVLERAAGTIEDRIGDTSGMPAMASERAAEGMHAAAGYLKEHDTAEIVDEVEQYVRAHPMRSLATAVAAGFVVGRILR